MIVMAVDPGLTGAIAWVTSQGGCTVLDLPTVELPGNGLVRRRIDGRALAQLVLKHCPAADGVMSLCEHVGTMGGQNNAVQTQGSLMRSLGAIEAVLEVLRMPPTLVRPRTWKAHYGVGADKKASLEKARALYPCAAADLKLAKHHNRAEAVLIAHYGLVTMS